MKHFKTALFAAAICFATSVSAQEYEFGIHGGLNHPTGDLNDALDGRPGITLGGHVGIYLGNGHEIRPRLDMTYYEGGRVPVFGGLTEKLTITAWGLGGDYLYYTSKQPTGLYLTGGLGYQSWDVSSDLAPDSSKSSAAFAFGAGYRLSRNFMLEGRYTSSKFRSNDGQATAIQALASLRF